MNNLNDIAMDRPYAAMLGYTEEELRENFAPHLLKSAANMGITETELLENMRDYYDGFSFDGETRLYNPFSVLQFFDKDDFRNFWFDSGSPSFLVNHVKKLDLEVENP